MDVGVQLSCSAGGWMVSLVVLFYLEKIRGGAVVPIFTFSLNWFSLLLKREQRRLCCRLLKTLTFFNAMLLLLRPCGDP